MAISFDAQLVKLERMPKDKMAMTKMLSISLLKLIKLHVLLYLSSKYNALDKNIFSFID